MTAGHIVLAGDSIFDNDGYVPGEPGVIEQLRRALPPGWSCAKVAVDGDCVAHVPAQVADLPAGATDLVLSVGGNDARGHSALLSQVERPEDLPALMAAPLEAFRAEYAALLDRLAGTGLRIHVCTIYTAVPFEDPQFRRFAPLAIAGFNAVIRAEAEARGIPVIWLEEICTAPEHFSALSPIEPSARGGQAIVDHIVARLT